ncbi:MAG: NADP-dependent malic enzyme [Proteobacteria bacterium]|nr:NADP-dependent malic enzyme [Pseudomonadota bacterium]MCP4917741.1 NADP-dependent malic enzyme [Pseudomonadota bacterium]
MDINKASVEYHEQGRPGKLEVVPTKPMLTQRDLSMAYTPGVAEPCRIIAKDPDKVYSYTAKGNLVAVVTNGTAVLGLGNIGPEAGKPVMEGKANLFKKFADIDVFDIELNATTAEEVIAAVKAMAPTFGGINLEDISAPDCFEIERRLQAELDIPVFHDDQHGTAIIAAAALLNAVELAGKTMESVVVVFSGAGAAAIATANLLQSLGIQKDNIRICDSKGLVHTERENLTPEKQSYAYGTERKTLGETLVGADVFMGLSVGGVVSQDMVKGMGEKPILFAMANPDPEIPYDDAKAAVPNAIVATGRSDYPNQINNVLGFPFVFRGALDVRAKHITEEMKLAAVRSLAALAKEDVPDSVLRAYGLSSLSYGAEYLIPKPFDPRVLTWVAPAVAQAAADSGAARMPIEDMQAYKEDLEKLIETSREFLRPLMNRAALSPKRIAFPDGADTKVLRAAQILVDEGVCQPVLIGKEWKILKRAEEAKVDLTGIEIIEPTSDPQYDELADELWKLRQRKGWTRQRARQTMRRSTYFGTMLVRTGRCDGLVGGLATPYNYTLRPALEVIGADAKAGALSGTYAMLAKGREPMFFGDCTVNVEPDAETLAAIAMNTARVAKAFGVSPRVALLSYSDFGEHRGAADVDKVRKALAIIKKEWPELPVDGEVQADTAVSPSKASLFPFSDIAGKANVLIFPNLASGNIAYKLLRELGGVTALGPLVVGLNKPVNVLALGSDVDDIVNITALTVNQAIGPHRRD